MKEKRSTMQCIDTIVQESDILQTRDDITHYESSWRALKRVYTEWERVYEKHPEYTIRDLLDHVLFMRTEGIALSTGPIRASHDAVRCMTAHKSKGMEFSYVYVIRAYDGHWGNKRVSHILPLLPRLYTSSAQHAQDDTSEDRRLFYVALTRGKQEVSISWARYDAQNRERLPSVYIQELRSDMCAYEEIAPQETIPFHVTENHTDPSASELHERAKVRAKKILYEKGISVTGLNNYLACPWKYFYVNLLGIPQVQQIYQMFGTAIHATLHDVVLYAQKQPIDSAGSAYIRTQFEKHLRANPLSDHEYDILKTRGIHALDGFVVEHAHALETSVHAELRIRGVAITPEVTLNGVLDRVNMCTDGSVYVTDYKTGAHKSRADIEGHTKASTGNILRQLIFYKMLLDAYEGGTYRMEKGSIAFVEPDEKGRYHTHEFTITHEQTEALRVDIQDMIRNIETLSFWDTRCEDVECPYCALRFTRESED